MNDTTSIVTDIIRALTDFMRLECKIEVQNIADLERAAVAVSITTPDHAKVLIGQNGQNLKSLEHIVRLIVARRLGEGMSIAIDVNDYRKSKTVYAVELARQVMDRVRNTRKAEALAPMSAYERRVVHMELASCSDIATESIGEEPQRRVVIKPFP